MDQILATGEMVTLIHFISEVVPEENKQTFMRNLQWRIACMPNMAELYATPHHPSPRRTDDVRAVNCPMCKETAAYKKSLAILEAKMGVIASAGS